MAHQEEGKPPFRPPAEPIPSPHNRDFLGETRLLADFLDEPLMGMQITSVIPFKDYPMFTFTVDRIEENEEGRMVLLSHKSDNRTFRHLQMAIREMSSEELEEYTMLISNVRIIDRHVRNHFNWPRPFNTQIV